MKHAKWVVALLLVAFSGLASAQMHSGTRIVTQVPFEFVVADKIVPAGECVVQKATMDSGSLMIRNSDAKVGLFASSYSDESKVGASHYALIFTRYGDQYFLSGITLEGSKVSYHLPQSKAEAELRAQNVSATQEILLASRK